MIDRKTYLEICQKCAISLYSKEERDRIPKSLMVKCQDIEYYPLSYSISFDRKGSAIHKAILLDKNGNSINGAHLKDIERVEE